MAARTGRPYKLQVLSTNGERKLQGDANNPTISPQGFHHETIIHRYPGPGPYPRIMTLLTPSTRSGRHAVPPRP